MNITDIDKLYELKRKIPNHISIIDNQKNLGSSRFKNTLRIKSTQIRKYRNWKANSAPTASSRVGQR